MKKKCILLSLLVAAIFVVSGCSNSKAFDHTAIKYQDTILNLGDTKEDIEKILGEGFNDTDRLGENFYLYNDETLVIEYEEDIAILIESRGSSEDYQIYMFDYDMSEDEAIEVFTEHLTPELSPYNMYYNEYDKDGEVASSNNDIAYTIGVTYHNGKFDGFFIYVEDISILTES